MHCGGGGGFLSVGRSLLRIGQEGCGKIIFLRLELEWLIGWKKRSWFERVRKVRNNRVLIICLSIFENSFY